MKKRVKKSWSRPKLAYLDEQAMLQEGQLQSNNIKGQVGSIPLQQRFLGREVA